MNKPIPVAPAQESQDTMLTIILSEGEDGFVIAECPQLPGCMSQGKTREEARENILDAMKSVLLVRIEQWIEQSPSSHSHRKGASEESFRFEPELISIRGMKRYSDLVNADCLACKRPLSVTAGAYTGEVICPKCGAINVFRDSLKPCEVRAA